MTWEEEKKMRDWGRAAAKRTVTAGRLPDLALTASINQSRRWLDCCG